MTTDETSNAAGPQDSLAGFPLPGSAASVVAVPAPGHGPGYWAGASSAAFDEEGTFVIGYRVRNGHDGAAETVIARSDDGERFTTVATSSSPSSARRAWSAHLSSVPRRGAGVCTSAAPTLEVPTGGSTQSMPTSRKGSLLPTLAPSSPATASPASKIHWCSVRARDGRPGSAATFSISPARRIA